MGGNGNELNDGPGKFERWSRIPSKGREPFSGLSRGTLYNLINAGLIKSANIKRPGCRTGCRLIWLPSLLSYIERHVEVHPAKDGDGHD